MVVTDFNPPLKIC